MNKRLGTVSLIRRKFTLGAAALLLAGCSVSTTGRTSVTADTGQTVKANETVKVALLVPSGSGDANLDRLANNFANAARLAKRDFSGVDMELTVYSTGGNAGQAARVAKNAVNNGAKIIIGPLFAEAANAVGNAVVGDNVNVLSFSNNTEIAGGNVFVLGNTFQNKANRIVGFAASKGYKSVASISPQNTAGEIAADAISTAAKKSGVTFAGNFTYPFSPDGIVSASPNIAAKIKSTGASAIVLTADSDGGLPILAQMLPNAGVTPDSIKYLGITRWDIPSSNLANPGLKGGWFTLPDVVAARQFNERFTQAYGQAPHPLSGLAYDGISAVAKLLQSGNSRALTKSALTRKGGFRGTSGVFRFNKDGTNQRALAVAEGTGKTFRIISGAPTSFSGSGS